MRVIEQYWEYDALVDGKAILAKIERAGRTCYKSEDRITEDSAEKFVASIMKRGHESVLEHAIISVRVFTDRGVTHEIVRHRVASYSQESTRYCNYGKAGEVVFVRPVDLGEQDTQVADMWERGMKASERYYLNMLANGATPQFARSVLPNSLKTEIVMTMNIREWRHFFHLRTAKAAHPQMRALAIDMLNGFKTIVPVVFDDIEVES